MNNIIIYNTEDGKAKINLILDDSSVWLSQNEKSFFATVQNKMHFAVHHNTASEVIYKRVDSKKEFIDWNSQLQRRLLSGVFLNIKRPSTVCR